MEYLYFHISAVLVILYLIVVEKRVIREDEDIEFHNKEDDRVSNLKERIGDE